ncbi:MAG: putative transcriptional regulator [Herbinix sp.]|jgi:DNA-binding PadR family transcriptional regulator|nr:putative transcriptional regulator [Herbinix sp.]
MAIKNKTKYAILGVLCLKPCSGYDIKKFCDKTISHYWSENFGHIYPVLKQLQEEHFIQPSEDKASAKRNVFQITDEGKREFVEWLMLPPEIQSPRSELMLKLSFGNYIAIEHVIAMLGEVKDRNIRNLAYYRELEGSYLTNDAAKKDPAFPYWLAPLRHGILTSEVNIRWCEETVQNIKQYAPSNLEEDAYV